MSPKERAIAEAALRGYPAADHEEVFSQIAEYTRFAVDEVEEVVDDLTTDKTLQEKYDPMLKPTPQLAGSVQVVQTWYEKGPMWDQPRTPRVW